MKRVVVTGMGVVSPLGGDVESFFEALLAGRSGIRRVEQSWADTLATPWAGTVQTDLTAGIPRLRRIGLDRGTLMALHAGRQAWHAAGLAAFEGDPTRHGVYWGTGMGGAGTLEAAYREMLVEHTTRLRPTTIVAAMNNAPAGHLSIDLCLRGPGATYSVACASSAVAIGEAARVIRLGLADRVLAGGSEALLTEGVMKAWESLGTVARAPQDQPPETAFRPFAADRSGFLLGEGAAAVVLEEAEHAQRRGARVYCELAGYGNTTDATHITQPDDAGQARAMRAALADARLEPAQIAHVNAHGTATRAGDVSETRALHQVFGEHARSIAISATKALHGHLIGATGALEFVAAVLALERGVAPPTAHLWNADPECDLDYLPLLPRPLPEMQAVMSNSFGFGGTNAVLVAKRWRP